MISEILIHFRSKGIIFAIVYRINRVFCRLMYGVSLRPFVPMPSHGPALIVANHSSFSDPLVLSARAKRPITFLVAKEVFNKKMLKWVFVKFGYVPVDRKNADIKAVRELIKTINDGQIVGVFPQGGIDEYRNENGHPGVGYLALKTGVPVIPVWIEWKHQRPPSLFKSLVLPNKVSIHSGAHIKLNAPDVINRLTIDGATNRIMEALVAVKKKLVQKKKN